MNVRRGCPGLHLLKWPVVGALCDHRSQPYLVAPVKGALRRIEALEVECVLPQACRHMFSVVGFCSGEGLICLGVLLDLNGNARADVEWFA
ncbi:hypothetical protein CDL15_Pgr020299 [Punica granatum]|uniref:Uncharacterized protein n=1 Tax=Punica granatum TaxID=22663 RepID=A0A218Y474_PUNGR|nr:hypothetical protein CDL15_Pgr020299 [Punica granatum]